MFFAPSAPFVTPTSFPDILKHIGYGTGLQLGIDAGDIRCYPGTGQTVTDQTDAHRNLTFGSSTGVDVSDPTFVGTAGLQTSGQYFRFPDYEDTLESAADAFSNSLHKNDAKFTVALWARVAALDAVHGNGMFGTLTAASLNGFVFGIGSGSPAELSITFYHAGAAQFIDSNLTAPVGSIAFYALSYNETSGAWIMRANGGVASGTQAQTAPGSANADGGISAFNGGDPSGGYSGDLFAAAVWDRALSSADLLAIYNATKGKYGL